MLLLDKLDRASDLASRASLGLSAALLFLIALAGVVEIFVSYIGGFFIGGIFEFSSAALAPAIFLALPYVNRVPDGHVVVDQFTRNAGPRLDRLLRLFANLVGLVVFGFVAWCALLLASASMAAREFSSGAVAIPIYPFKVLFALGAVLIAFDCFVKVLRGTVR